MSYRVVVMPAAEREFQALYDWIAIRSREGAGRWANAYFAALSRLAFNPEGYGLAPEGEDHPETIRQFLFKTRSGLTYRAIFAISDDQVFVLHVRGPGQAVMRPEEIEGL